MRNETKAERAARYAAKDVTAKLGVKPGFLVRVVGTGDAALLKRVRDKIGRAFARQNERANIILYYPRTFAEITPTLTRLVRALAPNGGIWVITFKKNKGAPYIPDSQLIPAGLAAKLVDNKICSVSDSMSAMRFVIRKDDRRRTIDR
ncbi:MAG: DUF3052 family protein [Chloroflexi bacterium]|nr:DUF3052 family protein [Chloroflexota bacterium]